MKKKEFKLEAIEGGEGHGTPECGCPFCRCKCPVCGTTEIEVTFQPKWMVSNDMENNIDVLRQENFIQLECPECGDLKDSDDFFEESNANLSGLARFFDQVLNLPSTVMIKSNEDDTINIRRGY